MGSGALIMGTAGERDPFPNVFEKDESLFPSARDRARQQEQQQQGRPTSNLRHFVNCHGYSLAWEVVRKKMTRSCRLLHYGVMQQGAD